MPRREDVRCLAIPIVRKEWKPFLAASIYSNRVRISSPLPVPFLSGAPLPSMSCSKANALPTDAAGFHIRGRIFQSPCCVRDSRVHCFGDNFLRACTGGARDYPFGSSLTARLTGQCAFSACELSVIAVTARALQCGDDKEREGQSSAAAPCQTQCMPSHIRIASVLIATDFSSASEKTLCHALAMAHRFDARFCIAQVVSSLGFSIAGPEATRAEEDAICHDGKRLEYELRVWEEIENISCEQRVDLAVIGTRAPRGVQV